MSQVDKIITTAERYLGIKESPPNSNNVVFNTRYYGRSVSGSEYAWCCAFVWCLFQDIDASDLFYDGKKTASCTTLMNWAKSKGQFHTSGFKRGDIVLFNWSGGKSIAQHIGIVTVVKNGSIESIEGNTDFGNDSDGGQVMRRTRTNNLIIGVYRPNYEEDEEVTQEQFEAMYKAMMDKQGKLSATIGNEFESAKKAGITDGTRPQAPATRQEVAVMVYRGMKK